MSTSISVASMPSKAIADPAADDERAAAALAHGVRNAGYVRDGIGSHFEIIL